MNEQEFKAKLSKIVCKPCEEFSEIDNRCVYLTSYEDCPMFNEVFEALIAAGIGDVSVYKHRAERAEDENAELKARLEKAVELPCRVGDTVYEVYDKCDGHNCPYNGDYGQWRCHYEGERRCKPFIIIKQFCYSDIPFVNKTIFVLREAAEARLAELRGTNAD